MTVGVDIKDGWDPTISSLLYERSTNCDWLIEIYASLLVNYSIVDTNKSTLERQLADGWSLNIKV